MILRKERRDKNEYRINVHWYLVFQEPITLTVLRNRYGLNTPRQRVERIKKNWHKAEEMIHHLEEEYTQYPQEVDENEIAEPYREGNLRQTNVNVHERSLKARAKCIAHYGCYGFNFVAKYGAVGKRAIEVHHITPLSQNQRRICS